LALHSPNPAERPPTAPNPARSESVAQPPFQLSNSTDASVSISISSPAQFHAEHHRHLAKHDELRNNINSPFLKNPRGQKDHQQTEDRTTFYINQYVDGKVPRPIPPTGKRKNGLHDSTSVYASIPNPDRRLLYSPKSAR
jgi:hypothetical protein